MEAYDKAPAHFCESNSMAIMIIKSHTVEFFFPVGQFQGIGISRRSDHTNGLSWYSASCLNSGGQRAAYSFIPRHTQTYLNIYWGHFEHLL
ncbi:hypothetical protein TNCV_3862691 [Trichonephila clavipes]|uniref:Uncharacterized protein n=1 Tax=Trichonephila clavipes TaxID=2585209 RepID=A0A8X6VFZ7_TRICX|nr:hypothetical protein TNCV_3862691 [Trichonephila clavipes]